MSSNTRESVTYNFTLPLLQAMALVGRFARSCFKRKFCKNVGKNVGKGKSKGKEKGIKGNDKGNGKGKGKGKGKLMSPLDIFVLMELNI